jgi:HlyD family secretion protein
LAVVAIGLSLSACDDNKSRTVQGWVEADLVFVSPDQSGRVVTLSVKEGDAIDARAPLFTIDDDLQQADLSVQKAAVANAQSAYDRAKELLKTAAGTQKTFDDAEAALRQAKANLVASETRLTRRTVFSPMAGTVEQLYYRPGETVPAMRPVVALLPPENLKIRFFVPQAMLPSLKYGGRVDVSCDGCAQGLSATVSFIARSAEYTPPVIYSLDERAKLVFLIEAHPVQPEKFRVGQPVSVTLAGDPAK